MIWCCIEPFESFDHQRKWHDALFSVGMTFAAMGKPTIQTMHSADFEVPPATIHLVESENHLCLIPPTIGAAIGFITSDPMPDSQSMAARLRITTVTVIRAWPPPPAPLATPAR